MATVKKKNPLLGKSVNTAETSITGDPVGQLSKLVEAGEIPERLLKIAVDLDYVIPSDASAALGQKIWTFENTVVVPTLVGWQLTATFPPSAGCTAVIETSVGSAVAASAQGVLGGVAGDQLLVDGASSTFASCAEAGTTSATNSGLFKITTPGSLLNGTTTAVSLFLNFASDWVTTGGVAAATISGNVFVAYQDYGDLI